MNDHQTCRDSCKSWTTLALSLLMAANACGYRVASSSRALPSGIKSMGVPTFRNRTQQYKLEQQITSAVLKELSQRARVSVSSNSSGVDAVLLGEIVSASSVPVTFGQDTFGSAFLITVELSVKLVRLRDSAILWENSDYRYRERYVLNSKLSDFFSEENPALDRLARDFAAALTSTILNGTDP